MMQTPSLFKEAKVEDSRYTVQDTQLRSPAAAEDLKCHCNVLAALPALQHLFQSAVLGSDFKKIVQRAGDLTFCLLGRRKVQETCDPFITEGTHR